MGRIEPEGLTEQEILQEEAFLADVPLLNVGALLMPPIWGAAHGDWMTILFYPIWLFCDNLFYAAWSSPSPLSIAIAVIAFVTLTLLMLAYARISSPRSAHRAAAMGKTREQYLRTERIWAVCMAVLAVLFLAGSTWYNLSIRPTLG